MNIVLKNSLLFLSILIGGVAQTSTLHAEEIGEVSTVFKWLGPNDKIVVEAFDDPEIPGVTCYLSRPTTGGIQGGLGLAEDKSNGSLACRQTGAITVPDNIKSGDVVFQERTSLVFKTMQVVRFFDKKRHALVYLVYSDRIIDGSPQNSVSAIAILPWGADSATHTPQ